LGKFNYDSEDVDVDVDVEKKFLLACVESIVNMGFEVDDLYSILSIEPVDGVNFEDLVIPDEAYDKISNFLELASIRKINELNLSLKNIIHISRFSVKRVNTLKLNKRNITDISALSNFIQIRNLNLNGNDILDLSSLKNLVFLKDLRLNENVNLVDITPLKNSFSLRKLSLGKTSVKNIDVLFSVQYIRELNLAESCVEDFTPLLSLKKLTEIDLSYTVIPSFKFINLEKLSFLGLKGVEIKDFDLLIKHLEQKNIRMIVKTGARFDDLNMDEIKRKMKNAGEIRSDFKKYL